MADNDAILLDDDLEADFLPTTDYLFDRIGDPVPIKPSPFNFDPQNPPSQPLAISKRHDLIFVALPSGFCVAKTKDVIVLAGLVNLNRQSGGPSSVLESSLVNVPLGEVRILALSFDNSTLAASVGGDVHFFSVLSLREQELNPSFSRSLNEESHVKDIRWRTNNFNNSFLVLSQLGNLYHGHGTVNGQFLSVRDNVDAVEWSIEGDYIVVARENRLSILSPEFEERSSIVLSFNVWIGDFDANRTVKVDSIRWVRRDSIIVGCFQLTEDSKEESYLVQVIRSNDGNFSDGSIAISFHDLFSSVIDDILPFGSGPYLLSSYLEQRELAFIANKKNTDQYIKYLSWSNGEVSGIDIERDTRLPRIELQENDDDNLILGICTYKVPLRLAHAFLGWRGLTSSGCILMCLTVEGKFVMFNFRQSDDDTLGVMMMKLKLKLNYLVVMMMMMTMAMTTMIMTTSMMTMTTSMMMMRRTMMMMMPTLMMMMVEINLKFDYLGLMVVMMMMVMMKMMTMMTRMTTTVMVELEPKLIYLVMVVAAMMMMMMMMMVMRRMKVYLEN